MKSKITLSRGLLLILVTGTLLFAINVLFILSQTSPSHNECVCNCALHNAGSRSSFEVPGAQSIPPSNMTATPPSSHVTNMTGRGKKGAGQDEREIESDPHQLALVVPFRNRFEELLEFAPHMHQFLDRQKVRHQIWVINQADSHRFNRASLLNIGFILSRNECDYLAMHDVDLLPLNDDLLYSYPNKGPFHVSSPELHPLYHYKTFVGGILLMSRAQFDKVNGLSNMFWGWGREDDELYVRMKEAGMKVYYPQGIKTGYNTFKHIHDKQKRPRDQKRYYNQWEMSKKRDRETGIRTVQYRVESTVMLTIADAPVNFVNVELECDYEKTPFCDNPP